MTITLNRRSFLRSSSLSLAWPGLLGLPPASLLAPLLAQPPARPGKLAAVFHEMSFFSNDDASDGYIAPRYNQATVDYVSGLSDEALLRRHWFA